MKLAVVTVNYHNQSETVACLTSLKKSVESSRHRLIYFVIDNEGDVSSARKLKKAIPYAEIISSSKNLGFAGGSNLGIKKATETNCDAVLLINPDTIIKQKGFLDTLLSTSGDIVAPVIQYSKAGRQVYDLGGRVDYLFGRNTHLVSSTNHSLDTQPDYLTGACLLIHKRVIDQIGLLDNRYFLYYEDADYCLRAKHAGFKVVLSSKAVIWHSLSTTTDKIGKKKIAILAKSHWWFCRQHLSLVSLPFYTVFNLYLRLKTLFP